MKNDKQAAQGKVVLFGDAIEFRRYLSGEVKLADYAAMQGELSENRFQIASTSSSESPPASGEGAESPPLRRG